VTAIGLGVIVVVLVVLAIRLLLRGAR